MPQKEFSLAYSFSWNGSTHTRALLEYMQDVLLNYYQARISPRPKLGMWQISAGGLGLQASLFRTVLNFLGSRGLLQKSPWKEQNLTKRNSGVDSNTGNLEVSRLLNDRLDSWEELVLCFRLLLRISQMDPKFPVEVTLICWTQHDFSFTWLLTHFTPEFWIPTLPFLNSFMGSFLFNILQYQLDFAGMRSDSLGGWDHSKT